MTRPVKSDHTQFIIHQKTSPRTRPPNDVSSAKILTSSPSENPALDDPYQRIATLEKELAKTLRRADSRGKEVNSLRKRVQELEPEMRRLENDLEKNRRSRQASRSPSRKPTATKQVEDDVALRGRLAAAENQAKILQLRCEQLETERKSGAVNSVIESGKAIQDGSPEANDSNSVSNEESGVRRIKRQLEVAERRVKNSFYISEAHEIMAARAAEREQEANARAAELDRKLQRACEKLETIQRRDAIARLTASCCKDEGDIYDTERDLRVYQMDPELHLPVNTAKRRQLARLEQRLLRLRRQHEGQLVALEQTQAVERLHSELRSAVSCGDLAETERLLGSGVSVNAPDEAGHSALMYACGQANEEVVRAMIDAGGDVLDGNGKITGLIIAARKGLTKVVQTLIHKGAEVHARDSAGGTALHASVFRGNVEVSRVLLEAGSDSNAVDHGANTPLHVLATSPTEDDTGDGNFTEGSSGAQLVSLLLKWGASPDIKNLRGLTPLTAALEMKRRSLVLAYREFFGEDLTLHADTSATEKTSANSPRNSDYEKGEGARQCPESGTHIGCFK